MPKVLKIDQLIDSIAKYIQVRLDIAKADLGGQLSGLIAGLFSLVLVLFFLAFFCLFISMALAIVLNEWLDSTYWGYVIIAGGYLVLFIIAIRLSRSGVLRDRIKEAFIEDENTGIGCLIDIFQYGL